MLILQWTMPKPCHSQDSSHQWKSRLIKAKLMSSNSCPGCLHTAYAGVCQNEPTPSAYASDAVWEPTLPSGVPTFPTLLTTHCTLSIGWGCIPLRKWLTPCWFTGYPHLQYPPVISHSCWRWPSRNSEISHKQKVIFPEEIVGLPIKNCDLCWLTAGSVASPLMIPGLQLEVVCRATKKWPLRDACRGPQKMVICETGYLVGGWTNPPENYESQLGWLFQIYIYI